MNLTSTRPVWTGRHILITFLLFFGTIIAVNVTALVLALKTAPGTVDDNAYLHGLQFDQLLREQKQNQQDLGTISLSQQTGYWLITRADDTGQTFAQPLPDVWLKGVVHNKSDRQLEVIDQGSGRFAVQEIQEPGQWLVAVSFDMGSGKKLQQTFKLAK